MILTADYEEPDIEDFHNLTGVEARDQMKSHIALFGTQGEVVRLGGRLTDKQGNLSEFSDADLDGSGEENFELYDEQ